MEENEVEEQKPNIGYKIMAGKEYVVNRNDYNGKTFYNIIVSRKNLDDTIDYGKKIVRFRKDVELQDKTKIKILNGFEDFYQKDKYNTIFTLFISDFEIVSQPDAVVNEAYQDFNSYSDIDLPF